MPASDRPGDDGKETVRALTPATLIPICGAIFVFGVLYGATAQPLFGSTAHAGQLGARLLGDSTVHDGRVGRRRGVADIGAVGRLRGQRAQFRTRRRPQPTSPRWVPASSRALVVPHRRDRRAGPGRSGERRSRGPGLGRVRLRIVGAGDGPRCRRRGHLGSRGPGHLGLPGPVHRARRPHGAQSGDGGAGGGRRDRHPRLAAGLARSRRNGPCRWPGSWLPCPEAPDERLGSGPHCGGDHLPEPGGRRCLAPCGVGAAPRVHQPASRPAVRRTRHVRPGGRWLGDARAGATLAAAGGALARPRRAVHSASPWPSVSPPTAW